MRTVLSYLLIFFSIFIFTNSCTVQKSPVSGNKRAYAYTWEEEIQIGQDVDKQIIAQYGLYQDDELSQYVESLSQDILANSHMRREDTPAKYRDTEFTFRVLDSPVVNAFALPGGYVYVTRGLMAHLENEAQFSVVIGHEIGHVAARHASQRGLTQTIGQVVAVGGAILGQEFLGLSGENLLALSSQAAQLLYLSYSRDNERESDELGVEYAAKTGYAAAEGAEFFTSLKRISENANQSLPTFLSSHPDPGEREKTIPRKAQNWAEQGYEQTIYDAEEYMNYIDGIIYGNNPRHGFTEDGLFYHPDLEFQFPVPENWQVINQAQQVALVSPEQNAVMIFQIDSEASNPQKSVQNFLSSNELQAESQQSTRSSGRWDAYAATTTAQGEQQDLGVHVYAVEYEGNIYRFINYSSVDQYSTFEPDFKETTTEFDRLTDQQILNINPVRLKIISVDRRTRFRDLLPGSLPMDIQPEEIAILNQVQLDEMIEAGTTIKIPIQ
ncbi:MAG: M48 family metalloprotease [Balneolaceae bacterium]|nr:M48 family metalloprotease [Balneolaceae bacterium]